MIEAIVLGIIALLGVGVAAYSRGYGNKRQAVAEAKSTARAEVATEYADRRKVERSSELAKTVARIHAETRAAVASRRADRTDAQRLLREARAWDTDSEL